MSRRLLLPGLLCPLVMFIGSGCAESSRTGDHSTIQTRPSRDYCAEIKSLATADVAKDVADALAAGDTRFVGVMGVAPLVPGAPDWARFGSHARFVPNTSDAIESEQHAKLQQVAYDYAKRYNEILLAKMPSLASSRPGDATRPAE